MDKLAPLFNYNNNDPDNNPTWNVELTKEDDKYRVTVDYAWISGGYVSKVVNSPAEIGQAVAESVEELLSWMK